MDNYKHFVLGENNISQEQPQTYIIKLSHPACSIRFSYPDGMFSNFEDFFKNVADVQFFNGDRPSQDDVQEILVDSWNFLCMEENELDNYNFES